MSERGGWWLVLIGALLLVLVCAGTSATVYLWVSTSVERIIG